MEEAVICWLEMIPPSMPSGPEHSAQYTTMTQMERLDVQGTEKRKHGSTLPINPLYATPRSLQWTQCLLPLLLQKIFPFI